MSASASINNIGTFTVAPQAGGTYNGGAGVSDFAGSITSFTAMRHLVPSFTATI